jgi:S1-C subfamily serine protease
MVDQKALERVRPGICAIGYFTRPWEEALRDPERGHFGIVGTGFLVRPTLVATNAHVVTGLQEVQERWGISDSQRFLLFVYPIGGAWQTAYIHVQESAVSPLPHRYADIAFLEFERHPHKEFERCQPLGLGNIRSIRVGDPIAVCGYPFGEEMLQEDRVVYRFGPVLQQGHLSAISPYDIPESQVDQLLLDLRTAGGMSGSPVFLPQTGEVVGILRAGTPDNTTSMAIPFDSEESAEWLDAFDAAKREAGRSSRTGKP